MWHPAAVEADRREEVEGSAAVEGVEAVETVETDRREEAEANCAVDAVEVEAVVHRGVRALYTDNAEFFARFDGVGIASDCTRTGSVARHVGLYIH